MPIVNMEESCTRDLTLGTERISLRCQEKKRKGKKKKVRNSVDGKQKERRKEFGRA